MKLCIVCLIVGAALLPGCLIGSESSTSQEGEYVSPGTLESVRPGATKEEVTGLLGEPTTKTTADDGTETWKWEYREETTKKGTVFLLLHSKETTAKRVTVFVRFQNGRVTKTWQG